MLVELAVENLAVIESVRVRFHAGLNLLTGETGSGKSIVVDSLGLLLGGRASSDMVRTGADRARVSGIFEPALNPALLALLETAGIELEDGELLIEREIQANGKSRAFASNRPVTAAFLRDLAPFLADIHGQHDQQQLFSSDVQCRMLDSFAGAEPQLERAAQAYQHWKQITAELEELDRTAQEKLRMADLWRFQRNEIEAVSPKPGEDTELENERRVLRNVVRLQEIAGGTFGALSEDPDSVTTQLGHIAKRIDELARVDASVSSIQSSIAQAQSALDDAARDLGRYVDKLEADPARLDDVETRLAAIEKLKRKYGGSIEEVLAFLAEATQGLATVETSSDRRAALDKESAAATKAYETAAAELSAKRREAAVKLSKAVAQELAALAMDKTRVEIRVTAAEWSPNGADHVEFLIAPNQGEELKPLEKIASGGELSRVSLALKTAALKTNGPAQAPAAKPRKTTSVAHSVPHTLVFDEVDAGVGGSAAEAVGRRLKKLSSANQVLCVTHLPQIAGFGDHHYFVEKHAERGRTVSSVTELTGEARTREIGRMLSGERITPDALRHAEQLLKMATT